jgi:chromosomal replication initiation ATPase DnaA
MDLKRRVCFEFDVDVEELSKPTLTDKASLARKVLIYFMYMTMNGPEIQADLSIKVISSIYNSVIWVRDNMSLDKELQKSISRIQRDVKRS